ncbi:hypothetical protein DBR43_26560 [Pedobacter sp. KBW06]|nr:hypothetical protein DBR43_26560 [Pedobacter sp. KBW06]
MAKNCCSGQCGVGNRTCILFLQRKSRHNSGDPEQHG